MLRGCLPQLQSEVLLAISGDGWSDFDSHERFA